MPVLHFFRRPGVSQAETNKLFDVASRLGLKLDHVETEHCFNIEVALNADSQAPDNELAVLRWLFAETFEPENLASQSFLVRHCSLKESSCFVFRSKSTNFPGNLNFQPTIMVVGIHFPILVGLSFTATPATETTPIQPDCIVVEIGPRLNFATAWSTNATAIIRACGLTGVGRVELSKRYKLRFAESKLFNGDLKQQFLEKIHDRMTECVYDRPIQSFKLLASHEPWKTVPILEEGRAALERLNFEMGLALDDWDLDFYTTMFRDKIKRNPTTVECFDISQSNSEHSRHWFFKGDIVVDGVKKERSLLQLVQDTLLAHPTNSVIAFRDNSSSIRGFQIKTLQPSDPTSSSLMVETAVDYDITFTAETHNFPTGVAPFPGAETGTGGRLRDGHATGRGSLVVAGTVGYSVGNLHIPDHELPWEDKSWNYPRKLAPPLQIEIDASNGASDYGNKFGEPVIAGFTRSVGIRLPNGERREYLKPIMFTGGIGQMDHTHVEKGKPEREMYVVKIGGPAYRIGLGGGAASSMVSGQNKDELDFNAVQRGDAEMEQKLNRAIRACVELGAKNPIVSIHDQGAGGNANVLKEIVEPAGALIEVRRIPSGDETLSVLELWGAEYQENDALLVKKLDAEIFDAICKRENTPYSFVGEVTGTGRIVLHDELDHSTPVDLELETVLGKMPNKTFSSTRFCLPDSLTPLSLVADNVREPLERVLRLLSVGSKRFLTNKVDRSVTGLVAQQQCVGPLHTPLADFGVIAQSFFSKSGAATSIGEQPLKGLISPEAMGRITLGEAMTNLVWAHITGRDHIKASGNWMWPAKLSGEGDALYRACEALKESMIQLGPAIDGGKDSLSMAAKCDDGEVVKAPGTLVVSLYCTMNDVSKKVTPDIKFPGQSSLIFVDLGGSKNRMGGSALAQVYGQVGNCSPDMDDITSFAAAFDAVQGLVQDGLIAAGHDRSDGGLLVAALEMAFAGNCGLCLRLPISLATSTDPSASTRFQSSTLFPLFSEELGLLMEVHYNAVDQVLRAFTQAQVNAVVIGDTQEGDNITVLGSEGEAVLQEKMTVLRDVWESTSFALDARQAHPGCVQEERDGLCQRKSPKFNLTFMPNNISTHSTSNPRVAVIRQEGSNGDREMSAAFHMAGFNVWDVTMSDLESKRVSLELFRGVAFVGGFSYADVLDSGKGWAGTIRFNPHLLAEFTNFYNRSDTFSLGICNGCQLMALMGWVPATNHSQILDSSKQPRFIRNKSGRFESRFVSVKIFPSPCIFFAGMEDSVIGVWSSHGEGRVHFPDANVLDTVISSSLAPLRYVDDSGDVTEKYPFNPNGSQDGIAALCSHNGRHLAMMPHPERTIMKWNFPWMPADWHTLDASPWLRLFQNARTWCEKS